MKYLKLYYENTLFFSAALSQGGIFLAFFTFYKGLTLWLFCILQWAGILCAVR